MTEKTCTKCGKTKPLTEFYKDKNNPDGHRCPCKACRQTPVAKLLHAARMEQERLLPLGKKRCSKCREIKALTDFHKRKTARDGHRGVCKVCQRPAKKRWQQSEAGRASQQAAARRYRQTERYRATKRRWIETEKGQASARSAQRRHHQTDKYRATIKRRRESEHGRALLRAAQQRYNQSEHGQQMRQQYHQTEAWKEIQRRSARRYRQTEKGKTNAQQRRRRRRAHKLGAKGSHTAAEFLALCQATGFRCLRCGHPFPLDALTQDHVVPLSEGGTDWIENIQPLCGPCNSIKHTDSTDYRDPAWQHLPKSRQLDLSL